MSTLDDLDRELKGWRAKLLLSVYKLPKPLLANALIALRDAPEWHGVLGFNDFSLAIMTLRPPPWLKHEDNTWTPRRWTDHDDALATDWLQKEGIGVPVTIVAAAVETVAKDASFHPVRDYLGALVWDGAKRVEKFAARYLGAEETAYHGEISKCTFIAAVARVMQPGCKSDHVPILEGEQDAGKSTAIERLFAPWYTDDLAELGTKDAQMQLHGAWGVEIGELASMKRADIDKVKAFISRKVDRFRPSYGRHVIEAPRQCIFIGSTNADTYLKDETGGRRFWPIKCGLIDIAAITKDRDQLWAEAVALFNAGAPWWITDGEIIGQARSEQADRYMEDPWQKLISDELESHTDTSVDALLAVPLCIERARRTQADQNRVARCLRQLGWQKYRTTHKPRQWRYRRPS